MNSLLNIAYLTQITNLQISNKNPLDYVRKYIGPNFDEISRRHFLPSSLTSWVEQNNMPDDGLKLFVEARLELILGKIGEYLGGITVEVIDTKSAEDTNTS